MSIRIKEWFGKGAEVAANFILPGLGGFIFPGGDKKSALWQVVLSLSGMVMFGAGAGIIVQVFATSDGGPLDEEQFREILSQSQEIYKILMALAGIIFGGVLTLGGFLWSLDSAMKRWRNDKSQTVEPPEIPGT